MTLVLLLVFIGIAAWAWSGRQRERFAEAARLPLEDELALLPASTQEELAR